MSRRSPWAGVTLAVAIVAIVAVVDQVIAEPPAGPDPIAAPTATSPATGSWVCGVGDDGDATTVHTLTARPNAPGSGPADVDLVTVREGNISTTTLGPIFPPSHLVTTPEFEDEAGALRLRWSGAPAIVTREWHWEGSEDLPAATVAGPCVQPFSPQWTVPGMSSAGGHEARLRLINAYRTDATLAVHFVTPEGVRAPIALQNFTVPAQTVRELNLNEVIPEEDDLAAVVEVRTGRLAVEGYQITRSAIGGVDGGSLLAAAPAPQESWTVPWVADDGERSSWLWVVNTGDRTAPVELTLHTPDGGDVPDGLAELTVPPGELRRVDLTDTLPDGIETAAVTVRSDGAPIVVSAAVRVAPEADEPDEPALPELDEELEDPDAEDPDAEDPDAEDPDAEEEPDEPAAPAETAPRTGFAVQLGVPELDARWTVSGVAAGDREEWLRLVNPSGQDATVDVRVFDGSTVIEPEGLQELTVAAGTAQSVALADHLPSSGAWTAFVTATDGELVVGRVGRTTEGPLRLVTVPGVPSSAVVPAGDLLAGVEHPGLVSQLGTALGLRAADPFGVPTGDEPATPDDAELDQLFEPEPDEPAEDADEVDPAPDAETNEDEQAAGS